MRLIAIDTVAEGDRLNSGGNLDDPQFRWLERELEAAERARRADRRLRPPPDLEPHEPARSTRTPATARSALVFGPGCDLDPRRSRPLHRGPDLQALLLAHPHVVAFVAGHTHENRITAFKRGAGGFWGIETASEIDWPIQSRLLEIMDNRDGTLSIFGTLIDHGATLATPAPGTPAAGFDRGTLAALGREFAYNDPQVGFEDGAEGRPQDRNVELLVRDPR